MSKMLCPCGSTIADQTDRLSNKGAVIRDQDKAILLQSIAKDISSFIDSVLSGIRDKWIVENYLMYGQADCPASEVKNDQVIDFILSKHIAKELCIYQCVSCGNIMIETDPFSNRFETFTANNWEPWGSSILQSKEHIKGLNFRQLS